MSSSSVRLLGICRSFIFMELEGFGIRECDNNPTSSGRLVTVIPRSDAESSGSSQMFLLLFVLDSASGRGMTVTNRLFETQKHINSFIPKGIILIPNYL